MSDLTKLADSAMRFVYARANRKFDTLDFNDDVGSLAMFLREHHEGLAEEIEAALWDAGSSATIDVIRHVLGQGGEQAQSEPASSAADVKCRQPAAPDPHEFVQPSSGCQHELADYGGGCIVRCNRPADDPIHASVDSDNHTTPDPVRSSQTPDEPQVTHYDAEAEAKTRADEVNDAKADARSGGVDCAAVGAAGDGSGGGSGDREGNRGPVAGDEVTPVYVRPGAAGLEREVEDLQRELHYTRRHVVHNENIRRHAERGRDEAIAERDALRDELRAAQCKISELRVTMPGTEEWAKANGWVQLDDETIASVARNADLYGIERDRLELFLRDLHGGTMGG